MNDINTATVRTGWNGTIVSAIIVAAAKIMGWEIQLEDLGPFLPVITLAIVFVYRISLVLGAKWPVAGFILFGKSTTPSYVPDGPVEVALDAGSTSARVLFPVTLVVSVVMLGLLFL